MAELPQREYVSGSEIARALNVTDKAVILWRRRKLLEYMKVGKLFIYTRESVVRLYERRKALMEAKSDLAALAG